MADSAAERLGAWSVSPAVRRRLTAVTAARAEAGVRGVAYLLGRRLRVVDAEWLHFFVADGPRPAPVEFRWATPDDAALLTRFGATAREVRERMGRGDRCAVVEDDGELAAYIWFATDRVYAHNGLTLRLGPEDAWAFDAEVAPRLRGRRLFPRLLAASLAQLRVEGLTHGVWAVDRLNAASLRASGRGGRCVATVVKLRVGPLGAVRVAREDRPARWRAFRRGHDLWIRAA